MKTKLFFILIFVCTAYWGLGQDPGGKSDKEVAVAAANAGKDHFLNLIQPWEVTNFGFNSTDEFSKVTLGTPYKVVALNSDFYNNSNIEGTNYLVYVNKWIIPLKVDDDYRVLLTVAFMDGVWKAVNIGSSGLAKDLAAFEKGHPDFENPMLMNVYEPYCEFILFSPDEQSYDLTAFPVSSSKFSMGIDEKDVEDISLDLTLKMIKYKTF